MSDTLKPGDIDKKKCASRLYDIRCADKPYISQRKAAERVHVSPSSWNAWENGDRAPSLIEATAIAFEFNVSLEYLIGKTDVNDNVRRSAYDKKAAQADKDNIDAYFTLGRQDRDFIGTCIDYLARKKKRT